MSMVTSNKRVAYLQSIDWWCSNDMVIVAQVHEDCNQITVLCVYLIPPQLPCSHLPAHIGHLIVVQDISIKKAA